MKTLFLLLSLIQMPVVADAQQTAEDTVARRDIGLIVLDKKNRPAEGIIMYSSIPENNGIMTDAKGHAVLKGVSDKDTLWVVLPESERVEIPLAGQDSLKIRMKTNSRYHVVSVKKDNITTPVNSIDDVPALLKKRSYTSLASLLTGMFPGLNITTLSDGTVSTNIRGPHSINSSSEPMVLLDGMEIGTLSDANMQVNIYDIQSITVDKEGSMYGVRGANGVIKIQTIGGGVEMY